MQSREFHPLQLHIQSNPITAAQISKLMIIPTSCVLEFLFQGKRYSARILATVVLVLVGVGAACAHQPMQKHPAASTHWRDSCLALLL